MGGRPLVTAQDVAGPGEPRIPEGAILTPMALDVLRRRGLSPELLPRVPVGAPAPATSGPTSRLTAGAGPAAHAGARRLVVANWKSHKTIAEALAFAQELAGRAPRSRSGAHMIVCPPFTAIVALGPPLRGVAALGAQDVSAHDEGPYTGEVAARHLVEVGCAFAIVGHSERRQQGETDEVVRAKVRAALRGGLDPILCVGETKDERRGGRTQAVVSTQLRAALEGLEPGTVPRVVVAYEPRWAIGQGVTPTPSEVADVLAHVRGVVVRVAGEAAAARTSALYGGSVSDKNAAELLALPHCAGALVGGASLKPAAFAAIFEAA